MAVNCSGTGSSWNRKPLAAEGKVPFSPTRVFGKWEENVWRDLSAAGQYFGHQWHGLETHPPHLQGSGLPACFCCKWESAGFKGRRHQMAIRLEFPNQTPNPWCRHFSHCHDSAKELWQAAFFPATARLSIGREDGGTYLSLLESSIP